MEAELAFLDSTLLPRSLLLSSSSDAATAQDLEFVQSIFLKSLDGSAEVLEQAKAVLAAAASDPLEARFDDGDRCGRGHPEGRRQALGRKRARFSMKPDGSKEPATVDLRAKLETIVDPEEYFSALDKIEVAEKELKKLMGQDPVAVTDKCQNRMPRQRRLGLLGKSARFKHLLPESFDTNVEQGPSQEINEVSPKDPPDTVWNVSSQEGDMIDTGLCAVQNEADKENKVNNILDTLLSSFETLSETEATALLQERLKLKQIAVDRIHLPVTPATVRSRDELAVADVKSIGQRITRTSINCNRSPLATISLLKKQMMSIDPLTDPYSSPLDESPSALADGVGQNKSLSHPSSPIDSKGTVNSASNMKDSSSTPRTERSTSSFMGLLESLLSPSDKKTPTENFCEDLAGTSPLVVDKNEGVSMSNGIYRGSHDLSTGNQYFSGKQVDSVAFEASTHRKVGPCLDDLDAEIIKEDKMEDCVDSLVANEGGCGSGPMTANASSQSDIHAGEKGNEILLKERQSPHSKDIEVRSMNELAATDGKSIGQRITRTSINCNRSPLATISLSKKQMMHIDPLTFPSSSPPDEPSALADGMGQNKSLSHRSFPIDSKETVKSASNVKDSSSTPRTERSTLSFAGLLESLLSPSDRKTPNENFCVDLGGTSPPVVDKSGGVSVSKRIDGDSHDLSTGNQHFSENQGDGVAFEASTHRKIGPCLDDLDAEINTEDKLEDCADSLVANEGAFGRGPMTVNGSSQSDIHAGEKGNEILLEDRQSPNSEDVEDRSRPSIDAIIPPDAPADNVTMSLEQDNESSELQCASKVFRSGKLKKVVVSRKPKPKVSRKSLAEAGTRWESGVRRSTRIRSRPLEYWRGERFLYGRIHDSLATVIGVKYSSPGGNQQLKVKSFVSEEYAELVEMAGLH